MTKYLHFSSPGIFWVEFSGRLDNKPKDVEFQYLQDGKSLPSALLICIPRVRRREGGQEQGGKEAAMMQVERKERNY